MNTELKEILNIYDKNIAEYKEALKKEEELIKLGKTSQLQNPSERRMLNDSLAKIKTLESHIENQDKCHEKFSRTIFTELNKLCSRLKTKSPQCKDISEQLSLLNGTVSEIMKDKQGEANSSQKYIDECSYFTSEKAQKCIRKRIGRPGKIFHKANRRTKKTK